MLVQKKTLLTPYIKGIKFVCHNVNRQTKLKISLVKTNQQTCTGQYKGKILFISTFYQVTKV